MFPDIYKESTLPKADPKLRPGDQSVLFFCQALEGMTELSASEDRTEVSNTMVSTFFPSAPLIGHVDKHLRAAIETCKEVQKEFVANDMMGSGWSDIDMSPTTPVMPWSMCASNIEDSFDIVCMDTENRMYTERGLDTTI